MAASACHITTDLSHLSLYNGTQSSEWTAPDAPEPEQTASAYRQRAQAAAQWLSQQGPSARRLSVVCVDTSETLCTWIQSRSPSYQVLASAYHDQMLDWGEGASSVAVEPILSEAFEARQNEHAKKRRGKASDGETAATSRVSTAVITQHDALVRLWLDALDQRGVRPSAVISLWHALALAWAEKSNNTSAVLYISENHRLTWCWSRNGDLLTGGTVASPRYAAVIDNEDGDRPPDAPDASDASDAASEHRLSLDWLSWGAHLGTFPESVKIISAKPSTLGRALAERFAELRTSADVQDDPIGATLERAAASIAASADALGSRRCLVRLTKRPTRAVRRRYRLSALALALASASFIGMSVRLQNASASIQPVISEYQKEQRELLTRIPDEELQKSPRAEFMLRSLINEKRKEPVQIAPPAPAPIFAELESIIKVCASIEDVQLTRLILTGRSSSEIRLDKLNRRAQLETMNALNEGDGSLRWERRGGVTNTSLQLNGTWQRGGAN